jgi:hypothetical protein
MTRAQDLSAFAQNINSVGNIETSNTTRFNGDILVNRLIFPPTQVSSSDANTLDDYEEGTWNPVFVVTFGSITYTGQSSSGRYTKIGNTVNAWFSASTTLSGSGNTGLTNLPFNSTFAAVCGGCRENSQTGAFFQCEGVNGNTINVLRRYDNNSLPTGTFNVSGFVTYQTN